MASKMAVSRKVGIIGTGDFARALAKRLLFSGYDVILGSRTPERKRLALNDECSSGIRIVTTGDCIQSVSIIFLAIHVDHFKEFVDANEGILENKIIIDVSNRDRTSGDQSNAEFLQNLVPKSIVVKAFNVISAFAMENDYNTCSRQVFIASNSEDGRTQAANIARDMNFWPVDFGCLVAARRIEAQPLRVFPDWRGPLGFVAVVLTTCLLYMVYMYYIADTVYQWERIFVKVSNKAIGMTAIITLSTTYLASSFAAIFQLRYGTKHIRFPWWLDSWLKCRKQLGLLSFMLITVHVFMSVLIMSPTYMKSWYHSPAIAIPPHLNTTFKTDGITWMRWYGEAASMTGIIAYVIVCIVCATTFPSVTDALNWREWRFAQSKLGHVALFISTVHVFFMGINRWLTRPNTLHTSVSFLSSIIPWITLALKIIFSLPCVDSYIMKIRRGWERSTARCELTSDGTRDIELSRTKKLETGLVCEKASLCPDDTHPVFALAADGSGCAEPDRALV